MSKEFCFHFLIPPHNVRTQKITIWNFLYVGCKYVVINRVILYFKLQQKFVVCPYDSVSVLIGKDFDHIVYNFHARCTQQ